MTLLCPCGPRAKEFRARLPPHRLWRRAVRIAGRPTAAGSGASALTSPARLLTSHVTSRKPRPLLAALLVK